MENNIRMDLKEIGVNTRNWVDSAQDRDYWRALVNAALYLQVHLLVSRISHDFIFSGSFLGPDDWSCYWTDTNGSGLQLPRTHLL